MADNGFLGMKQNKSKCPECGHMVWTLLYNGKENVCMWCHPTTKTTTKKENV